MIRIFFLAIFRNMKRNKIYTLINLAGLVIGLVTYICLLYTSPSPRDGLLSRMPSSA